MANIQDFDAGNLKLNPTETGVQAVAGTARRIGAFSNQLGSAEDTLARETSRLASETEGVGRQTEALGSEKGAMMADVGRRAGSAIEAAGDMAVKYVEHQEISHGAAAYARTLEQKTQQWNDLANNSDPNDPTTAQRFMTSLNGDLEKFQGDGFLTEGGQKWAEAHVDALRQHFAEKTQADMAKKAGDAAIVNNRQTVNSLSSTAYSDPTTKDFALAALRSSTEGIISKSPNLDVSQASRVRNELLQSGTESIVKSAAMGEIEKTGKMPGWVSDPKYAPYVNGAELKMFQKQAEAQTKANLLTQKTLEAYQRKDLEIKQAKDLSKVWTDGVSYDEANRPIIKPGTINALLDIERKYPGVDSAAVSARIQNVQHNLQQKAEVVVTNPDVKADLLSRMSHPTNPTTDTQILMEANKNNLSSHDQNNLIALRQSLEKSPIKNPAWQDTIEAVRSELILSGVGLPGKDIEGTKNYAKWAQTFIPQFVDMTNKGTLPPNALDVKDPNSLISQSMAPFHRTIQQRTEDYFSVLTGNGAKGPTPKIETKAQFDALKSGDTYVGVDGKTYRKP